LADSLVLPINFAVELEAARDSSYLETLLSNKLLNFGNFMGKAILAPYFADLFQMNALTGFSTDPIGSDFCRERPSATNFSLRQPQARLQLVPETSL
jgi:hypothetical protein